MSGSMEMPKYQCHKQVWALKILGIEGTTLVVEKPYAPVEMGLSWMEWHKPEVGGYYVVYENGYGSYSPADVFEDGYTLIKE